MTSSWKSPSLRLIPIAASALLVLAACGGGGDSSAQQAPAAEGAGAAAPAADAAAAPAAGADAAAADTGAASAADSGDAAADAGASDTSAPAASGGADTAPAADTGGANTAAATTKTSKAANNNAAAKAPKAAKAAAPEAAGAGGQSDKTVDATKAIDKEGVTINDKSAGNAASKSTKSTSGKSIIPIDNAAQKAANDKIAASKGGATDVGITKDTIKLGSINMHGMALGNVLTAPQVRGNLATATSVNDRGGILGRRLTITDCDDGPGEVSRAKACIKKLAGQDKVFALVTGLDWATASIHDDLKQYKLPYMGAWAYSQTEWQDPFMSSTRRPTAWSA
jgi:hypothetical protein